MAKELPYFKFEPNEWENGNIQMLSREDKGLFIDLCSMYWSRLGDLPFKLAVQKLCGGNATALNSLCEEKIIEILDGYIFIKFLSEQLEEFEQVSKKNSKNAKDGWEKRRKQKEESERNATALNSQCETNAIREDKIREDKIKEDKNINSLSPINWESFLKFHNETFGKKARLINDTNKKKFLKLLKDGYTKEDIMKAMIAVKNDEFAKSKKYSYCRHLYFTRPDVIDRYAFPSEKKTVTNTYNGTL